MGSIVHMNRCLGNPSAERLIRVRNLLLVGLIAVCSWPMGSCSRYGGKVPFTYYDEEQYSISSAEINEIQFYVSHTIVLRREISEGTSRTSSGRLITERGITVEEVLVEKGTPGIVTRHLGTGFCVSFEEGTCLKFGSPRKSRKSYKGRYQLLGYRRKLGWWKKGPWKVSYDGGRYEASKGAGAFLLVDREALVEVKERRKVLAGRRLDRPKR